MFVTYVEIREPVPSILFHLMSTCFWHGWICLKNIWENKWQPSYNKEPQFMTGIFAKTWIFYLLLLLLNVQLTQMFNPLIQMCISKINYLCREYSSQCFIHIYECLALLFTFFFFRFSQMVSCVKETALKYLQPIFHNGGRSVSFISA